MKKILLIFLSFLTLTLYATNNKANKTKEAKAREWIKNQPLEFIENKGQFCNTDGKVADNVLFKTSFGNCDIYITDKGLSYVFVKYEKDSIRENEDSQKKLDKRKPKFAKREEENNKKVFYYRLDMNLEGANISKDNIIKEDESKQGHYNYFYAHCPQGIYDIKGYGKITIKNIYKGIDWVIYTNSSSKEHPLKYDFVVHPQADYKDIKIKFLNAQSASLLDNDTKLNIQTIAGNIEEGNLFCYQTNKKDEIQSKYAIDKDSLISFEIADYDTTKTLVIDPLVWATYYGGHNTDFISMCIDKKDNIYIVGSSQGTNFPSQQLSGAFWQANNAGGVSGHEFDVIIIKFDSLNIRQWATYYGGTDSDAGSSICSDSLNNIIITGNTYSINFPIQQLIGAYWQPTFSGGFGDIFILKFNEQGLRQWATYYGGSALDESSSIRADSQGNVYITGFTVSSDFPVQQLTGAYWQANYAGNGNAYVLKFNNQGVRKWATYYGGGGEAGYSMCIDSQDNIFITGWCGNNLPTQQLNGAYWQANNGGNYANVFILKFNNQGVRIWATYYGGNAGNTGDCARGICLDSQENIYITGYTGSTDFPLQHYIGAYWQDTNMGNLCDLFILKFNKLGVRQWATYYGGSFIDYFYGIKENVICADKQDNIYITGYSGSDDFPLHQKAGEYFQSNYNGLGSFLLKFCSSGKMQWASRYQGGGDGFNIAVNSKNSVFFTGGAYDTNLNLVNPGNGAYYNSVYGGVHDSYILKMNFANDSNIINYKPISVQSNRNNICMNDNNSITLTAIGGSGGYLNWYNGVYGQNYIGTNPVLTIPSPTQTTTYYACWESSCGVNSECDSIKIKILPINTKNIIKSLCEGESFHVGIHNYATTGNYSDTLIAQNNCDSIIFTNLTVNPIPIINLGNDITICEGSSLILNASFPNSTYLWHDNSTNSYYNVSHSGLYFVKTSIDSCSSIDSINIVIKDCEVKLELPNIITPNNDGSNDLFTPIKSKNIEKMNTQIFNRWGSMVYKTDNLNIEWDGKQNGKLVADGVYFWIINYTDGNGKQGMMKGSVTVMK